LNNGGDCEAGGVFSFSAIQNNEGFVENLFDLQLYELIFKRVAKNLV
jgi:hypothetical protein